MFVAQFVSATELRLSLSSTGGSDTPDHCIKRSVCYGEWAPSSILKLVPTRWKLSAGKYWAHPTLICYYDVESLSRIGSPPARGGIHCLLWNLTFQYRSHKSPPLNRIFTQLYHVHTLTRCFSNINFIFHLCQIYQSFASTNQIFLWILNLSHVLSVPPSLIWYSE